MMELRDKRKTLSIEILVGCNIGAWEIMVKAAQFIEAWFVRFRRKYIFG